MKNAEIRAQFADESEMRERAGFLASEGFLSADEQVELNALCAWLETPIDPLETFEQWEERHRTGQ